MPKWVAVLALSLTPWLLPASLLEAQSLADNPGQSSAGCHVSRYGTNGKNLPALLKAAVKVLNQASEALSLGKKIRLDQVILIEDPNQFIRCSGLDSRRDEILEQRVFVIGHLPTIYVNNLTRPDDLQTDSAIAAYAAGGQPHLADTFAHYLAYEFAYIGTGEVRESAGYIPELAVLKYLIDHDAALTMQARMALASDQNIVQFDYSQALAREKLLDTSSSEESLRNTNEALPHKISAPGGNARFLATRP